MAAARDLTQAEALSILGSLATPSGIAGRVTLPSQLEGVRFEYCDTKGCSQAPIRNVDPRFGVFLMRLAEFLRGAFNITTIRHFGIYPGGYGQPSHDGGIAIDIGSFVDASGNVFSILYDWGNKPPMPGQYRLTPSDKGYELFKAVYDFTSQEGDDKYGGAHSEIGTEDTYIRHPDLHDPNAAKLHKDHFHLQAGQAIKGSPGGGGGGGGGGGSKTPPVVAPVETSGNFAFALMLGIGAAAMYMFSSPQKKRRQERRTRSLVPSPKPIKVTP